MLSKHAVTAVFPLAQRTADQGLAIFAQPNTPLSELDRVTNSLVISSKLLVSPDELNDESFAALLEAATHCHDNPTQHDAMMDGFLNDLTSIVNGHLKFARNTVKPLIIDMVETFQSRMAALTAPTATSQFTIKIFDIPQPLTDMVLHDTVMKYSDIPNPSALQPSNHAPVNLLPAEDILTFILTGDREVDQAITTWYSQIGSQEAHRLLTELLTPSGLSATIAGGISQVHKTVPGLLLCFLYVNAVYNKNTNYADNIKLSSVAKENMVAEYRNYTGAMLCTYLATLSSFDTTKTVVVSKSNVDREIVVYGPMYRAWLQAGGRTEHLFAALNLKLDVRTMDRLLAQVEQLQTEWAAYSLFWTNSCANTKLLTAKEEIRVLFRNAVNNLKEEEWDAVGTRDVSVIYQRLDDLLAGTRLSDLDYIYDLMLKVVGRCLFAQTSAEFILAEIEEVSRTNKDIEPAQAALIASTHYVVDYLCGQMLLTDRF